MKNLKKIKRENLKKILGGVNHECNFDSDCSPIPGCATCSLFLGRRVCIMFSYDPVTHTCP